MTVRYQAALRTDDAPYLTAFLPECNAVKTDCGIFSRFTEAIYIMTPQVTTAA